MKCIIKTALLLCFLLGVQSIFSSYTFAAEAPGSQQVKTLDDLLKKVLDERAYQSKEFRDRENTFMKVQNKQKSLLAQAQRELARLEARTKILTTEFEKNEKVIAKIEEKLNIAVGTLGELFGVVRQVAGDFRSQAQASIISSQIRGRVPFLAKMAESKSLPGIPELEKFWFQIQQEMTESGKILKYQTQIVLADGEKTTASVVRVGSFNLISDGKYLNYQGETDQVVALARQPAGRFLSLADDFQSSKDVIAPLNIDPSRGAILSMLVQAPSLTERIAQGGIVGYVILSLLFVGLALCVERFITLKKQREKVAQQLASETPLKDNPLGEIMQAFNDYHETDLETLELKIDETIIRNSPPITRGLNTIKILSAVAPLLGLLGTVTGMIATFQSITLFGTGDPKLMAGGISQALVTTVLGLVCAIPLLLLYNLLSSQSKSILQILDEQSAGIMANRRDQKEASQ